MKISPGLDIKIFYGLKVELVVLCCESYSPLVECLHVLNIIET